MTLKAVFARRESGLTRRVESCIELLHISVSPREGASTNTRVNWVNFRRLCKRREVNCVDAGDSMVYFRALRA
jgi:hypothetical protein